LIKLGLDAAIKEAALLENHTTQNYPEYDKDFNDLLAGFPLLNLKKTIKDEIGQENYNYYKK
jgi:protease-4